MVERKSEKLKRRKTWMVVRERFGSLLQ